MECKAEKGLQGLHFITPLNICDAPSHKKVVWNTWELGQRHTPAKGACRLQRKPSQLLSKNSRSLGWRGTFHPLLTYKQVLAAPREQFGCEFLDHMFFFRDLFDVHKQLSLDSQFPQTTLSTNSSSKYVTTDCSVHQCHAYCRVTIDRYHDCISISPEKCSVQCQLVLLPSNVSFWGLETDNACR